MSLNADQGRYSLHHPEFAVERASWALYWLSDVLWFEQRGVYNTTFATAGANCNAVDALEAHDWNDNVPTSIVNAIERILETEGM